MSKLPPSSRTASLRFLTDNSQNDQNHSIKFADIKTRAGLKNAFKKYGWPLIILYIIISYTTLAIAFIIAKQGFMDEQIYSMLKFLNLVENRYKFDEYFLSNFTLFTLAAIIAKCLIPVKIFVLTLIFPRWIKFIRSRRPVP